MTNRVPRTVNILGHLYQVTRVPDGDEPPFSEGWCEVSTQRIWVNADLHREEAYETFIHEVVEGVNRMMDLEMSHQAISIMANAIYRAEL
jgi:hypothetical protein